MFLVFTRFRIASKRAEMEKMGCSVPVIEKGLLQNVLTAYGVYFTGVCQCVLQESYYIFGCLGRFPIEIS